MTTINFITTTNNKYYRYIRLLMYTVNRVITIRILRGI